jgi:signal peptidase I
MPSMPTTARRLRLWPLLAVVVVLAVGGGWWLRGHVLGSYEVDSGSMEPTLCPGDEVLVDKLVQPQDLHRDDLVVVVAPDDGRLVVKRVVGLPGDKVAIRDALLFVDRHRVHESYVDHSSIDGLYYGPIVVPPRQLWVMGDNRAVSIDSRDYGGVPFANVRGRVLLRWWSGC